MGVWAKKSARALPPLLASLAGPASLTPACAAPAGATSPAPVLDAPAGGPTSVPYGWANFCLRYSGECDSGPLPPLDVILTPNAMKEIERVDRWVNSHVKPAPDADWGVIDKWDYPADGEGDCEDYALFKRKILMEEGFPRQALLMTVVKDERNEGHAVLTVKTNGGEFVLDNMNDEVKPWNRTGYRFVKRQSQTDQNLWVQVGGLTAAPDYVSR
jgi:predicted transglutaminase-like cysteine proteinase